MKSMDCRGKQSATNQSHPPLLQVHTEGSLVQGTRDQFSLTKIERGVAMLSCLSLGKLVVCTDDSWARHTNARESSPGVGTRARGVFRPSRFVPLPRPPALVLSSQPGRLSMQTTTVEISLSWKYRDLSSPRKYSIPDHQVT